MSSERKVPRAAEREEPGYPTLQEHLATRRRFLGVAGATLAAGGLIASCERGLGAGDDTDATVSPDATPPQTDAHVWNDAGLDPPGSVRYPDYFTIRIPDTGDLSAYLIDEGYALFHVIAATEREDTRQSLLEHLVAAGDACRDVIAELTYDALSTGPGVVACESELLSVLDALVMEAEAHSDPTVVAVTLELSQLDPSGGMGGVPEKPSYP